MPVTQTEPLAPTAMWVAAPGRGLKNGAGGGLGGDDDWVRMAKLVNAGVDGSTNTSNEAACPGARAASVPELTKEISSSTVTPAAL